MAIKATTELRPAAVQAPPLDIMLRRVRSSIRLLLGVVWLISFLQPSQLVALDTETEQQQQQPAEEQEGQLHPYMPVAVKFWTRSSEFGERDNWRDKSKPCTLLERIRINDQSVVSMGDTLDALSGALEANIKELELAMDGVLLLEEDSLGDTLDPMFIQYLNQSGDCVDGEQAAALRVASASSPPPADGDWFQFEPESDHMSWFNPLNWASQAQLELNESDIMDWMPDARGIPCDNDIVVFGDRQATPGPTLEANERSKVLSFKVNFRPSEASFDEMRNVRLNDIRVARLKIGNLSFNQQEFLRLVSSPEYENLLFDFKSEHNLVSANYTDTYQDRPYYSALTIDESSIYPDSSEPLCMDEAGCLCRNYDSDIMKAICSFNYPLEEAEMTCRDPIVTAGFCNKICATVMTISMDPTKFRERFLLKTLEDLIAHDEQSNYLSKNVFIVVHRTHLTKYQVLFRHKPDDESDELEESEVRKVPQFAQLFLEHLTNAERSFYGVRSINIKSSSDWKISTRKAIFWTSFPILFLAAAFIFIFREGPNARIDSDVDKQEFYLWLSNWLTNRFHMLLVLGHSTREGAEPFIDPGPHLDSSETEKTGQHIPLRRFETDAPSIALLSRNDDAIDDNDD